MIYHLDHLSFAEVGPWGVSRATQMTELSKYAWVYNWVDRIMRWSFLYRGFSEDIVSTGNVKLCFAGSLDVHENMFNYSPSLLHLRLKTPIIIQQNSVESTLGRFELSVLHMFYAVKLQLRWADS